MASYVRLVVWATIWLILWLVITPIRRKRHNCITYAIDRWDNDGGYLVIRWCRNSKLKWLRWPHFSYLAPEHHIHLEHAQSSNTDPRIVPQFWFDPIVKHGDEEKKR